MLRIKANTKLSAAVPEAGAKRPPPERGFAIRSLPLWLRVGKASKFLGRVNKLR